MANGRLQLTVLGAVLIASSVQAQDLGSWTKKAPLPAAINEMQVVFAAGKIHALGGGVLGYTGPYHQEYDIRNDKWRPLARVPRSLDHMGAAELNGEIYPKNLSSLIGGGCLQP